MFSITQWTLRVVMKE